ncbi:MAG: winged helix DNA-binding protein [Firmicutes bacterium]|nr:winged helix DNA-binding protein [Bacillota bacterium]
MWWPAFRNFDHLHPEYEVRDFRDGYRYIDWAYIRTHFRLAIEIDGYGPHASRQSRREFADQWLRQNHLIIDDWFVLRFAFDDVESRPRACQQQIQQLLGRHLSHLPPGSLLSAAEREVMRLALRLDRPLRPADVQAYLGVSDTTAIKVLRLLVERGWLAPQGMAHHAHRKGQRVRAYTVAINPRDAHAILG